MSGRLGTVVEARRALDGGEVTSAQLVETAFARAAEVASLGALLGPRREAARAEAAEADARRAAGETRSPLDGVPVVLKDNIVQAGEPASCASRMLEGYRSPFDATVVSRLRDAGAVIIGRGNMDEFAMGSSTENSAFGPTRNPWDPERAPGGSSGGPAAAVATGIVPLALGSDTGGSIRQPAAFCGLTGMKPTYGRVSRYGLVAYASSLDQIGPLARTAADCAVLVDTIAGHDPSDSTSLPEPAPATVDSLNGDVSGLVLGIPEEATAAEGADPAIWDAVRAAAAELEAAGAKTTSVSLPHLRHSIAAYYLIATAEASSNLARYDGVRYGHRAQGTEGLTQMYERTRTEGFGAEVKRRILLGTYVLSAGYYDAYYLKAQKMRTLLRRDLAAATEGCDLLLMPTAPETAFPIGAKTSDPLTMYLSDVYTVLANLTGAPAISLPCGFADGLPIGLQLVGRPLEDATVLRAADAYQRRTDFHTRRPA